MGEWSNFDLKVITDAGHDQYRLVGSELEVYQRRSKDPEQFIPAGRPVTSTVHQLLGDGDLAIGRPEEVTCWDTSTRSEYTQPGMKVVAVQASGVYPPGGEPHLMADTGFAQNTRHTRDADTPNLVAGIVSASGPGTIGRTRASLGERAGGPPASTRPRRGGPGTTGPGAERRDELAPMSTPGGVGWVREWGLAAALAVGWLVLGGLWLALFIGSRLAGTELPTNPITAVLGVLTGTVPWPGLGASAALSCELLIAASLIRIAAARWWRGTRTRVDGAARHLGRGRELEDYSEPGLARAATRLRPGGVGSDPAEHGVYLGTTVAAPRRTLRSSWEDTILLFAGPRRGKSTCFAIRQLIEAPGAALVTSLRRDIWDATVGLREQLGTVWCFDPQQLITDTDPHWWFNPLSGVRDIDDARKLKDHFVAGTRGPDASTSAYFDGEGERLLAGLILAAAKKPHGSLLDVYTWLTDSGAIEPLTLLTDAGQTQVAAGINAIRQIPAEKQKAGVYGSAMSLVSCLENPKVTRWITPPTQRRLPQFDPAAFATGGRDTLYLHSKQGEGNVSPLVAALTQAVLDAGQHHAARSRGGRLDPPLLSILDEAANVCKIRNLPDQYSFFGGTGLPVMTVLQSFEQGVQVWGRTGMRKLLDTANVRVYGGGLADTEFLRQFAELLGDHDKVIPGSSFDTRGARSNSYQLRRQRILDTADLAALPRGRAVVLAAGTRPTIIEPQPWMDTAYAPEIRASITAHDPGAMAQAQPS